MGQHYSIECVCGLVTRVERRQIGRVCQCPGCKEPLLVDHRAVQPAVTRFDADTPRYFSPEEVPVDFHVGDVFCGEFEVLDLIGRGGLSVVHRIRHMGWMTEMAMKSPRPESIPNRYCIERLEQECALWLSLDWFANIVSCHFVRTLGRIPRIFMEYVDGGTLAQWIWDKRLYEGGSEAALLRVLDIGIQVARGLEFAHRHNVIHQDIKPGNILLTVSGEAKLTDFGMAWALAGEGQDGNGERRSATKGTRPYSPPEQLNADTASHKTDIWSWAASFFEMIVGGVTWADSGALLGLHDAYVSGRLTDVPVAKLPVSVEALVTRCLQADPKDRPDSIAEVVSTLTDAYPDVSGIPYPRALPAPAAASASTLSNRAISFVDLEKPEQAEDLWRFALTREPHHLKARYNYLLHRWRTNQLRDAAVLEELQDLTLQYPSFWLSWYLLGCALLESGDYQAAMDALRRIEGPHATRYEILHAIAVVRQRASCSRRLLAELGSGEDRVGSLALSSDGSLAFAGLGSGNVEVWDTSSRQIRARVKVASGPVRALSLCGDGRHILVAGPHGRLSLWDWAQQESSARFTIRCGPLRSACLAFEGQTALSGERDGMLRVWATESGQCMASLRGHSRTVSALSIDPSGRYAVSGGYDALILYWDVQSRMCLRRFTGHEGPVHALCLSNDRRLLVSAGADGTVRTWDVYTGKCLRVFRAHREEAYSVQLSANQHYILSGSRRGTFRVWDCANGQCLKTFEGSAPVCMSADGRYALSRSPHGGLRFWMVNCDLPRRPVSFLVCRENAPIPIAAHAGVED